MIKRILLTVSAIGGAVSLGRKLADKSIEKKLPAEIEAAKSLAIEELDREIHSKVHNHLRRFSLTLLIKAALVAGAYLLFATGNLNETAFRYAVIGLLAAYIGHDFVRAAPHIPPAWRLFREYGLNLKRALTEYVAGVAFERAYRETHARLKSGKTSRIVAVSNYSIGELSEQVADAVADVAASVSFDRIKPRAIVAGAKAATMMALYAAFVALIIWA